MTRPGGFRILVLSGVAILAVAAAIGRSPSTDGDREGTAAAEHGPLTVPFEMVQGLVMVRASLGPGDSLNLILDTGASSSVIGLEAAKERRLEVEPGRPYEARGAGVRRQLAYPTVIRGLGLGGARIPDFPGVIMDLGVMEDALGRRLDGALGYSFLQGRTVRLDYAAGRMTVYDGPAPDPSAHPLPMHLAQGSVLVDSVFVNGRGLRAHLDTGAAPALTISEDAVARLGLEALRGNAVPGRVRGPGGTAEVWRARADSVRVGDVSTRGVEVAFASFVQEGDAILGSGFFSGMVLTLDYVSREVGLARP